MHRVAASLTGSRHALGPRPASRGGEGWARRLRPGVAGLLDLLCVGAMIAALGASGAMGLDPSIAVAVGAAPVAIASWRVGLPAGLVAATGSVIAIVTAHATDIAVMTGLVVLAWFVAVCVTVTIVRRRLDDALAEACQDPLTGLLNRRGLDLHLTALRSAKRVLAVGYVDLDNFKRLNDSRGHEAGDAFLRDVAVILRKHVRCRDLVARMGGDEFVVVLADVTEAEACEILERVRSAIDGHARSTFRSLGASLGGVILRDPPLDPVELIAAADSAMYRAKRSGAPALVVEASGRLAA